MDRAFLPRIMGATFPLRERLRVPPALKYPSFRNYWLGMLASVMGHQMLIMFSLGWLIYDLTDGDARYVGYMSASIAAPAMVLNLFGGVYADRLNTKHLLGFTQLATASIVAGLAVLTMLDAANRWHVLASAFLIGGVQAFDTPTRQSIFPRLIDRTALPNAIALNSLIWNGTRIIAPAMAGIIIGRADISTAIFISAAGFLAMSILSQTLRLPPTERAAGKVFREMMGGFLFIKRTPIFSSLIGMAFFTSIFGMSYLFLMPVFANEVLEVGAEKIGILMGASGIGAIAGIVISMNLGKHQPIGRVIIWGAVSFGISLILFAVTTALKLYGLSMLVLFVSGTCNSVFLMAVMTTLHGLVPDQFRGRVMGIYAISWSLTMVGGLQANFIAHYISAPLAVAVGGSLVVAYALGVALANQPLRALSGLAQEH